MDRASQVLAQGVPKSYPALADHHGNVSYSTVYPAIDPQVVMQSGHSMCIDALGGPIIVLIAGDILGQLFPMPRLF